jgi:F-type H+-transporting ATPase subunit epsilon
MAQKTLQLTIARVDEPVFAGEVVSVTVPGVAGEMTLLANHTALISPLKEGVITYITRQDEKSTLPIKGGTLEISANKANILI